MEGIPPKHTQAQYYDERWRTESLRSINQLELERLISILQMIGRIQLKDDMQILDLGCGRGWLSSILSHIGSTTGIELSSEAIRAARERYPMVDFRSGDLFEVLKEEERFDLVVSQEVIEHVEDQAGYIQLVADSIKLGGYFVLTTPNGWTQSHRTLEEREAWGLQPIEHWLDRAQLQRLLAPRFDIVEIRSIIDGFGAIGICRFTNSPMLRQLVKHLGVSRPYSGLLLRLGFGLHLIALARRTA